MIRDLRLDFTHGPVIYTGPPPKETGPTFRNMYREGGRTVQWWTSILDRTVGVVMAQLTVSALWTAKTYH
jgi:hypothetical protein